MSLAEVLGWLALGCIIGFFAGYVTRALQEQAKTLHDIKEELDEVDEIVKNDRQRDEGGFVRYPLVADAILLLVIIMTVWAAFASQSASNEVKRTQDGLKDAQEQIAAITSCNQVVLKGALSALNERTTYSTQQSKANVDLQKSQAAFFEILLHKPPYSEERRNQAAQKYFADLTEFIQVSGQYMTKVLENPYPTEEELSACLITAAEDSSNKE